MLPFIIMLGGLESLGLAPSVPALREIAQDVIKRRNGILDFPEFYWHLSLLIAGA